MQWVTYYLGGTQFGKSVQLDNGFEHGLLEGVRLAVEPDGGNLSMSIALNDDVSSSSFEQSVEEVVVVEVLASGVEVRPELCAP